jgi:hypothetical protein
MRGAKRLLAAICGVAVLAGCGGGSGAPPPGVTIAKSPNYPGTLSDLASQVTTDVVLRHKGARLLKAEPYPPCPGEAGLQTFSASAGGRRTVLQVAFTQWTGTAVTASYERPAGAPVDPAAQRALQRAVCSSAIGG